MTITRTFSLSHDKSWNLLHSFEEVNAPQKWIKFIRKGIDSFVWTESLMEINYSLTEKEYKTFKNLLIKSYRYEKRNYGESEGSIATYQLLELYFNGE
jgi:hypothetical protein